jgi:drug/metabolite transporter (DMT)-like permease
VRDAAYNQGAPGEVVISGSICLIILIWAFNFIAAKIGVRYLPPLALASFRVTLAAALMVPVYLFGSEGRGGRVGVTGSPGGASPAPTAIIQRFGWRDLWAFCYLGFFGVAVNQICFTVGLRYTSVSHAAVIAGMGPIYTLFLAVLLGLERASRRKIIGMTVAFAGIAVLASDNLRSSHSSLLGDAIVLAGSLGFATYVVLGKRVATRYDSFTMTTFNHIVGALIVLPVAVIQARSIGAAANWKAIPWPAWAAMLYMAMFSSAVAYLIYFWLLRYLEATQLSAFTYALPIVATLMGIVWLGERASWMQLLGGAIALSGLYCIESGRG